MAEECVELGLEERIIELQNEATNINNGQMNLKVRPLKNTSPNALLYHCFSCLEPQTNTRFHSVRNRKCKQENVYQKLQIILGDTNLIDRLYKCAEAVICQSCLRKITFICSFSKKLKHGIEAFVDSCGNVDEFELALADNRYRQLISGEEPWKNNLFNDLCTKNHNWSRRKSRPSETSARKKDFASNEGMLHINGKEKTVENLNLDVSDEDGHVEMTECTPNCNATFLQAIPTLEHSYCMSMLTKESTELDSESTDSASENGEEPVRDISQEQLGKKQLEKNNETFDKSEMDKSKTSKSEVEPVISPNSSLGTVKSFTRVAPCCGRDNNETNETGKKKRYFNTPFRHSGSVDRFGIVTFAEKGSQVVDLTKGVDAQENVESDYESASCQTKELSFPLSWDSWLYPDQRKETLEVTNFYSSLEKAIHYRNMHDLTNTLMTHKEIQQKLKELYLKNIFLECQRLCTPKFKSKEAPSSILMKVTSLAELSSYKDFVAEIFAELKTRCPHLLDVLIAVTGAQPRSLPVEHIGPITSAYAILMKVRHQSMTGWHKVVSCLMDHGHMEERMMVVMNHIGLAQASSSKFRMLEKVVHDNENSLAQLLKNYPLAKIACDISNRPSGQLDTESSEIQVLAASLILIKDIDPGLDSTTPPFPEKIPSTTFIPSAESLDKLQSAYAVLVGRIIKDLPGLSWLSVPDHLPHSRSQFSTQKTEIHPLTMAFCYETRRNDGVKVLQTLQDSLQQLYAKCADDDGKFTRPPVPIGGDQMTKAQLEFVRSKKIPKVTQEERFNHLGPFVTEFCHNKKDFVVKAYQALYNKKSSLQPGTLYYFKSKMQLGLVTDNFQKNFDAHYDLLYHLGRYLILEQGLEYFAIDTEAGKATKNIPKNIESMNAEDRRKISMSVLKHFVQHFGYGFMFFKDFKPSMQKRFEVRTLVETGKKILVELAQEEEEEDEVYNYCMQLSHWALHLMEMEDTAQQGDADRLVIDSQYSIPFFFSFSPFSNQLAENVDFLIKVKHTLSPQMKELVLRTAFVNLKGGVGNCCETDRAHEQVVYNQKSLVQHLESTATDRMVKGSAAAADLVCKIADNASQSVRIVKRKTKSSQKLTESQKETIRTTLRTLRPFNKVPGRLCAGFQGIHAFPFRKASRNEMFQRLDHIVGRMRLGQGLGTNEDIAAPTDPEPVLKRKRPRKPVQPTSTHETKSDSQNVQKLVSLLPSQILKTSSTAKSAVPNDTDVLSQP